MYCRRILSGLILLISLQASSESRIVDNLSKAIRYQTISHQNLNAIDYGAFLNFHQFLETTYPRVHSQLKKKIIADYSLVYIWQGNDRALPPVLFDSPLRCCAN